MALPPAMICVEIPTNGFMESMEALVDGDGPTLRLLPVFLLSTSLDPVPFVGSHSLPDFHLA